MNRPTLKGTCEFYKLLTILRRLQTVSTSFPMISKAETMFPNVLQTFPKMLILITSVQLPVNQQELYLEKTARKESKISVFFSLQFGSHGMCENLYDVRYLPETESINEMQVSKTLNIKNCTGKPRVFSNAPGVRCLNKSCNIDEVGPTLACLSVIVRSCVFLSVW